MAREANRDRLIFDATKQKIVLDVEDEVFTPTGFAQIFAGILESRICPSSLVCELGIGTGVLSILAGQTGATVVGLDRNPSAIALACRNWRLNELPEVRMDFRVSDLFSGLMSGDARSFDLMWSNPPVLPELVIRDASQVKQHRHEISGPLGRDVLDAMLTGARRYLKAGGSMIVIATSLQGWRRTKELLDENWSRWSVIGEEELPLTAECGPEYVAWWRGEQDRNGEIYMKQRGGQILHKLWFIQAWES